MSVEIHDAIIVQGYRRDHVERAHAKAVDLGLTVTSIADSPINGFASFLIVPDGSHEHLEESTVGDRRRSAWERWAREQWTQACELPERRADQRGSFITFVHVIFGPDLFDQEDVYAEVVACQPNTTSEG